MQISAVGSPTGWTTVFTCSTPSGSNSCNAIGPINLSAYTGVRYVRFMDTRASGAPERNIDGVTITVNAATPPPVVTADPMNDTACAGTAASFAITATNATGYQWQEFNTAWTNLTNTTPYSGVTTNTLNISNATGLNGRRYRCVAIGAAPNDTSAAANLLVNAAPAITQQAIAAAVCPGKDTSFYIRATGTGLTYQWQVDPGTGFVNVTNGSTYAGALTDSLRIIAPATGMNTYQYRCVVTGICTPAQNSNPVVLTVYPLPVATITPSANFSFCQGDSITLNAGTGTGYTYQWTRNGSPIPGATNAIYKDTAGGTYSVLVTSSFGCAQYATPVIATSVPHSAVATPATSTTFCAGDSVIVHANTGTGFTYQWLNNGTAITGAVYDTLRVRNNGSYTVVVTNGIGCKDTSNAVGVVANAAPPASITAIGSLSFCQGDSVKLDAGFTAGMRFQWFLNMVLLTNDTLSVLTAKAPGSYSVKVATGSACYSFAPAVAVTVHQLPPAQLTTLSTPVFCQGDSILMTANAGPRYTYQWQRNNAAVSGATDDSLSVRTAGTYNVIVTDSNGCSSLSNTVSTVVNTLPAAAITPAGSTAICVRDTIVFNANTGARFTYQWYYNNALITGAFNAGYRAVNAGSYSVMVIDSNGCHTISAPVSLTVNPLPDTTVTLSGLTTFCQGNNVVIQAATGTNRAYQWSVNGNPVTGAASSYTVTTTGTYRVLVINTATGCKDTSRNIPVTVNPLPGAVIATTTPLTFCDGDSVVMHANTGTNYRYQWTRNTVVQTAVNTADYTVRTPGAYDVTVIDPNGCSSTSTTLNVIVNPTPSPTITYTSPLIFCQGGAVVLTAYTGPGMTYSWLKDGVVQGITTFSNIVSQSGQYVVIQTNSFGCVRASQPVIVSVFPTPVPVITRNNGILSTGTYMSYQWYRDNQPLVGETRQDIRVTVNGGYSVEVVDANGCTGRSLITFFNNVSVPTAAIAAVIKIYPNPVRTRLNINAPVKVNAVLRDLQGRIVAQQEDAMRLDMTQLAGGIYVLQLTDQDGHLLRTDKITKEN